MNFIDLKAVKETVDVKLGGLVTYETDQTVDGPGIILLYNPSGAYGMTLVDQVHENGLVMVRMKPTGQTPVKKFNVGDVVAKIAVF